MAELTHFYNEVNALGTYPNSSPAQWQNAVDTGSNPARIAGSELTANTKYLILARALIGSGVNNLIRQFRVQTDDDSTIEDKSHGVYEFEQTATGDFASYFFAHSYTTDGSPADIEFQVWKLASTPAKISHTSLFLLDLDAITAPNIIGTYHFDASDAGPSDPSAGWTGDANAFDGSQSTNAANGGTVAILSGEGTTAPTSGATIGSVQVRLRYGATGSTLDFNVYEDSTGGTLLYGVTLPSASIDTNTDWATISAPGGGWTWQKVNDLAVEFDNTGGLNSNVRWAEVRVLDENGLGYVEDIQSITGAEYSDTAKTTILCEIPAADLPTDTPGVFFGSARTDVGSTGRYFRIDIEQGGTTPQYHQAEGEDTAEQRISGFAFPYPSGSPVRHRIYGVEEAANGNMLDGGAYLIFLPGFHFADWEATTAPGSATAIDGTETTIASIGPYTPSVNGNHLVMGWTRGSDFPTQLGGLHVEEGTTEIKAGDAYASGAGPSHNQIWDNTKDDEYMVTFQRYSISSEVTFNLRAQGAAADFDIHHEYLMVLNLNSPAVAGGFRPFPRRQRPSIRM